MPIDSVKYHTVDCNNCGSENNHHDPIIHTKVAHYGHLFGDPLTLVTCNVCGLVFLNPQPTKEALNRFYRDEYYSKSQESLKVDDLKAQKAWQRDFLYTWLCQNIPEKIQDWDILDIGSGYGVWLQWFDPSNRISGIESSVQATKIAEHLFGLKVYQTEFLSNKLASNQFNLITGLAIIEHFSDPLKALVEMNRLLKLNAYLYLQTPDIHGMVLRQGIPRYFKVVHTYYYSEETLSSLLNKAGFKVIASRCRPPLVDTSSVLFPENYWSGELDILAVKCDERRLEEARNIFATSEDKEEVVSSVKVALRRDRLYIVYAWIYRKPLIRIPFKLLFRIIKKMNITKSIFQVQAERLGLEKHSP